jgi:polyhydroxyalkanoate synthesis repressor PhaR
LINQSSTNESMVTKPGSKTKIIKRYQNRKLYDTQQSCYVTLDDIAKMIRVSEDVMVIDNKTKNDITAATLTQIIFESEKKASQYAPLFTLREIIQTGNGSISGYLAKLGAFPKEQLRSEPAPRPQAETRTSFDDVKAGLDNRIAQAEKAATAGFSSMEDEETPSLPTSARNLSNN